MRRHHPNWRAAVLVAGVLILAGSGGCRSQPASVANPFLAPDRVPPPTTRVIAPGTAQPYYPGDPLPTMQSTVTPPADALTVAPTFSASSADNANVPTSHSGQLVPAAEGEPIGIPGDADELRFALPTPAPTQAAPAAEPAFQPPVQLAAVPVAQTVQPALYGSPPTISPTPVDSFAMTSTDPAQLRPWRSPQVAPAPLSPSPVSATISTVPRPGAYLMGPQPSMSVRLRPVPSPAADTFSTPRIRLPGYTSSFQQPVAPTDAVQQAAYVAPASGGTLQTVRITELPASGSPMAAVAASGTSAGPALGVASQPTFIASASPDGFRARGSTR